MTNCRIVREYCRQKIRRYDRIMALMANLPPIINGYYINGGAYPIQKRKSNRLLLLTTRGKLCQSKVSLFVCRYICIV